MPMKPEQHVSNVHKNLLSLSSGYKIKQSHIPENLDLDSPYHKNHKFPVLLKPKVNFQQHRNPQFYPLYASWIQDTSSHPMSVPFIPRDFNGSLFFVLYNQDFQEFTISCMSGSHPTNLIFYSISPPTKNTVLQQRTINIFMENFSPTVGEHLPMINCGFWEAYSIL